MRKLTWRIVVPIILANVILLTTRCSPAPEPILEETPVPPGVEVVSITEEKTDINQITQRKVFDQCEASSAFRPDVRFIQSESDATQEELILKATGEGEINLSAAAKLTIGGSVEKRFASSRNVERTHEEGGKIEVPPHTKQEYTLVWRETRRGGAVYYVENGESKTAEYSYRIGLELMSTTGKDLLCPGQETVPPPTSTPSAVPTIPPGYILFDEFDGAGELDERWSPPDGNLDSCSTEREDGALHLECRGNADADVRLGYSPRSNDHAIASGVAVAAGVLSSDHLGWFSLMVHFAGPDGSVSIRAYAMTLYNGRVQVVEFYPQEGWRGELLAEPIVTPSKPHTLQIEYGTEAPRFFLDGEMVQLKDQPTLPTGSTWQDWVIEGFAAKSEGGEPGSLGARVDWVAIKPATAISEGSDWHPYDDFTAADTLDRNWRLNDENQLCRLDVAEGYLSFDCNNKTSGDLGAALHPSQLSSGTTGVEATVRVEKVGGPFQLATRWMCQESGLERAYHLELGTNSARATELYPQEGWRSVELGKISVTPDQAHVLQIERTSDSIEFFVDVQPLPLDIVPGLSACFSMSDWSFDFWVWKDGNSLRGQITQVSVRY
jgi:hypothetical protein